jgi:hypothetical protein
MLKKSIIRISILTMLPLFVFVGIGLSPVLAYASTTGLSESSILIPILGRPDHVPPVNPPIDTPAFYNGLVNTPTLMPTNIPSHTLPGSDFGQAAVPIPAAIWLFGTGLLGLAGIARRKKT